MKRPNILYLHSHDTGRYVQPYGYAVPTPNIQRLADEAVIFRQAHCAAPTCSPSRAALLTGQCPHSCGQLGLANLGFYLRDTDKHLAHTLRQNNYYTALYGIQHLHLDPNLLGYDRIVEVEKGRQESDPSRISRYLSSDTTIDVLDFLKNAPSQPFFLTVGFSETHRVFPSPGPAENPHYCMPPAPLPDTRETREDMAAYKASARILDQNVGAILNALDSCGLAENTLVICTTDHGLAFPNMKGNLHDRGTGVMLILRGPGGFHGGKVCDALVSQIDIYPTLCELLNIDPPAWLEGHSMMPLIRNEKDEINNEIFAEQNYHAGYQPMRSLRTRRWKYIRHFRDYPKKYVINVDSGLSRDLLLKHGWEDRLGVMEELYDLFIDPNEVNNLAGDQVFSELLWESRERLDQWMRKTNDPLLEGVVPAPKEAIVGEPSERDLDAQWEKHPPNPWDTRERVDNRSQV